MMRIALAVVAVLVQAAAVLAQSSAPAPDGARGYIEAVAQSAFGNVTSQSYGVEAGATVWETLQVFGEFGRVRDVATTEISSSAQLIAGALSQVQPASVAYTVREPVTFFGGGVRYQVVMEQSKVVPYVMGGFGVAKVTKDVTFQLGGADATPSSLAQYVTIGTDLSGDFSKPMLTFGGGVVVPLYKQLIADLQYRFGRIFPETGGTAINVNRAGVGLGVRF